MRLDFSGQRVLAVTAHPDDAELLCAGTLARAKADGAAIAICVLCRGEKGQPARPVRNLAAVRRKETAAAARLLGARLFCCGLGDGELADIPSQRKKVMEIVRRFRATLVLAHSPEDYHSDHRAAGALAEAASWYCSSAGHRTRSPALKIPPELWWMDCVDMLAFKPGFYVDITEYVELKRRMLQCHTSQLERFVAEDKSSLEELMFRQCRARGAQAGVAAAEAFRIHPAWKRTRAW